MVYLVYSRIDRINTSQTLSGSPHATEPQNRNSFCDMRTVTVHRLLGNAAVPGAAVGRSWTFLFRSYNSSRIIAASQKPVGCVAQTRVFTGPVAQTRRFHRAHLVFIAFVSYSPCASLFIAHISCPPHKWGHFSYMECEIYLLQLCHRSATYFITPNPGTRQPQRPGCCPRWPWNYVQG